MPTSLPSRAGAAVGQAREQGRDLLGLEEVDQPHQHRLGFDRRAGAEERGDRVHDHHAGLELVDQLVECGEVHFQAVGTGTGRVEAQQALLRPGLQIQADGAHVTDHLALGLLEGEVQAALAASAGRVGEVGSQARLASARRTRNKHAAAAVNSLAAEHGVEPGHAGGNPLRGRFVVKTKRGDRQDGNAVGVDQKGILVRAVGGATVLDDAQPSGREQFRHAVVEDDDAVGDVLLEAVASERAVAALAGDDRRDPLVLEPAEQAAELGAEDGGIRQAAEERLEGVEHDAPGPERVDGVAQADEEAFEVVLAGLLDFTPLDVDEVHQQLVLFGQLRQVEPEGTDVLGELLGGLFEGQEDAGLAELGRAPDEELHREECLAAAGAAADEGGAAPRQPAASDFVEPLDTSRGLGERTTLRVVADRFFAHQVLRETRQATYSGHSVTLGRTPGSHSYYPSRSAVVSGSR